jgi:hypothetical protein
VAAKVNLELLVRVGCHLCESAIDTVNRVVAEVRAQHSGGEFEVSVTDIDANPQLLERYSDEVPVLFVNGAQRAFWRIDESHLRELLAQLTS